jgi:ABC-2 type transport system permease protein
MAKVFRDTRLLFAANLRTTLRNPVWVIVGLFQPICYLLLFAPLLANLAGVPGFPKGGAYSVFTPGLLIMMAIFSVSFAGFGLIAGLRAGVVERLRVTPVNRFALVLGLVARDVAVLLVQGALLLGLACALGLRPDLVGALLALALLVLVGLTMASASYGLALALKDENALASTVNLFALPLLLLSGITLPLSLAPEVLRRIAQANPFAYAVDAARALMRGNLSDVAVAQAFVIFGVLAVLALVWATRAMRQATI